MAAPLRKPTNVSLDSELVSIARGLKINLSRACEQGLAMQIADVRGRQWLEQNRDALEASNAYVDEHGLPLAKLRQF